MKSPRLKAREWRSLSRYHQTFGRTMLLSAATFKVAALIAPVFLVITLVALGHGHTNQLFSFAAGAAVIGQSARSIELRSERAKIVQEMHDLTEKTSFDAEASKRWKELDAKQKLMLEQVEAIERSAELSEEMRKVERPGQPQIEDRTKQNEPESRAAKIRAAASGDDYKKDFMRYFRTGKKTSLLEGVNDEARTYTALNTGSSASGDVLVPIALQKTIEEKMISVGGLRPFGAQVITTDGGGVLNYPTDDDTANNGSWISENAPVNQTNPTFGNKVFNSFLASSDQVLISLQLLQDSAFDLDGLIAGMFGRRLGRLTNIAYTNAAASSNKPTGLITEILAYNSGSQEVLAVGDKVTSGNTDLNSVGTDDLSNLIAQIDPVYRPGAKFMAHQATLDFFRKLKDTLGRPLWEVSIAQGVPDLIFGYEYQFNQAMDQIGAGKKSVVFGLPEKYVIRDVRPGFTMFRYSELYMPNHQQGFQAYLRTDGHTIQEAAFSLLVHPLS